MRPADPARPAIARALGATIRRLRIRRLRRDGLAPDRPREADTISPERFDSWLSHLYAEELAPIEAACAGAGPEALAHFRELDDDLWAVLLSRRYSAYPSIRALLPEVPDPELQERWNGASGLALLGQSLAFYAKAVSLFGRFGAQPLPAARVLDYGCGWGRLTRFFARDIAPGSLCGCDPVGAILDVCEETRVPADLRLCDFVPEELPFEEGFDLVFSFSVLTHLSEAAHLSVLRAIHASLKPGGLLIVTIRPPAYLALSEAMRPALSGLGQDPLAALAEPRHIFVPHAADPSHPQFQGEEMTYGEAVISLPYVRERWTDLYELLDVGMAIGDPHQVAVVLRRRD